jgi:hypothetical protein
MIRQWSWHTWEQGRASSKKQQGKGKVGQNIPDRSLKCHEKKKDEDENERGRFAGKNVHRGNFVDDDEVVRRGGSIEPLGKQEERF